MERHRSKYGTLTEKGVPNMEQHRSKYGTKV